MSWRERVALLLLTAAAVTLLAFLPRFGQAAHGPAAWDGPVQFSGDRAWADMVTLATRFPRRWSGGPDRQAAADWLADMLTAMDLEVRRQTFTAWIGHPQQMLLENVWALSPGVERPDEIIVAMGNYDMAPTSLQAASDTAGHVGAVLELARLFAAGPHRRTMIFLFPDGEEWGMLGAWHFARTFPERKKIVAVLSIEDLDPGNLRALGIDGIGQFRGFAPHWLRSLAASAASREGWPAEEAGPLWEWLQRSVLVSSTDQGPFLGLGIPAVDLAGRGDDAVLKAAVYHLPGDTVDKMQPAALTAYGRIQERILRTIDALPDVPRESPYYLRVGPDRIVRVPWLALAQVAVFVPLAAGAIVRIRRSRMTVGNLLRVGAAAGLVVAVMLVALAVLKVLPFVGLMPNYELHPATARHPDLKDVRWPAVLVVAAALAVGGWVASRLGRRAGDAHPITPEAAQAALLVWLLGVGIVALLDNPFGAVTFLLLAALLWIWVAPRRSAWGRIGNGALVSLGFLPLAALFAQYAALLELGGYILWYVFMALAYGVFTLLRVVLAFATIAIALRLSARP